MTTLTEADVERAALDWLSALGWGAAHGPDALGAERDDYGQAVLERRLRDALLPRLVSEEVKVAPWQ